MGQAREQEADHADQDPAVKESWARPGLQDRLETAPQRGGGSEHEATESDEASLGQDLKPLVMG